MSFDPASLKCLAISRDRPDKIRVNAMDYNITCLNILTREKISYKLSKNFQSLKYEQQQQKP